MINPDLVAQRDHPGSKLGKPGALQGINTGVNIFSLQIVLVKSCQSIVSIWSLSLLSLV